MTSFILASNNHKKIKELQQAFPEITLESYTSFGEPIEVVETGKTYQENALIKAKETSQAIKQSTIGDDGGLELLAFKDILGIHTSRFFSKGLTDKQMNEELLDLLKNETNRQFELHACLAYYFLDGTKPIVIENVLSGEVSKEIRGKQGYGFDTILIPKGYQQTLAELSETKRNELSPRNQAFRELIRRISNV